MQRGCARSSHMQSKTWDVDAQGTSGLIVCIRSPLAYEYVPMALISSVPLHPTAPVAPFFMSSHPLSPCLLFLSLSRCTADS